MERHFHRRNLKRLQQLPKATPVIVEADETVPYGRVMGTLEILRRARVTDFSLAVEGGKAS